MTNNEQNPSPETVALVRAHVAARVELLASCSRSATALNNSASRWARAELVALQAGITDRDAVQRAVCEKFPKLTSNGKVSKTPNSSFRTSFDKFVLLADILNGDSKSYQTDSAASIVAEFIAPDSKLTLNDAVDRIKADKAATARETAANESEADKASRKAREAAEQAETVAGIVANDGAVMLALAARLTAMDGETANAYAAPIKALMEAAEAALHAATTFVAEPEALAA